MVTVHLPLATRRQSTYSSCHQLQRRQGNRAEMLEEPAQERTLEASSSNLRHRPLEEQPQRKTNLGQTADTGKPNPNLHKLPLVA
jgi:hypothetical protein